MTNADALVALQNYYDKSNPSQDDEFMFTEALGFLIEETKDPKYMCELAWQYCSKKHFDLEIKYLEMAAESGSADAMEELGYMWYYGQHGEQDYDKAFYYFSKGVEGNGSLWCKYKLADMYHNGYSVPKDEAKYRELIEEAYEEIKNPKYLNEPYPEICLRLAGIRADDGKKNEAVKLLKNAKHFLSERLALELFWGHIEVMCRIIRFLYQLPPLRYQQGCFL
ncbi:MAG: sel1 repeat family protein [Lachnospiraceae bacterium]|nr:sel1 repeat family protein [Lachnospiraceae bacterium]